MFWFSITDLSLDQQLARYSHSPLELNEVSFAMETCHLPDLKKSLSSKKLI